MRFNTKLIDTSVIEWTNKELNRQRNFIELIASENFVSPQVMHVMGSILTNKYAEGYPGKRYYGGCEFVDEIETLAINRAKELFNAEHANVQAHSGSQANAAVYSSVLNHGDKVLGMSLNDGGHLTHGHKLNFSGKMYEFHGYAVDPITCAIDYDVLEQQAKEIMPKMIVAGASAYAKQIDFKRISEIAKAVDAYFMVDMAHIAGLVACGLHPNPVPYADFVTTTTHKTLRGPRGGLILCKEEYAKKIDSAIFPGQQGGPLMHVIAGKAVCLFEALQPEFKTYQQQVIKNAQAFAQAFMDLGFKVVGDGTQNHLLLIDTMTSANITGLQAQETLDTIGITTNKNTIPQEKLSPMVTSGLRIGTPAITTRGFNEEDCQKTAQIIVSALKNIDNKETLASLKNEVLALVAKYPMYEDIQY